MKLKNKKVIIAVTGGIAAYKVCELARLLIKKNCSVRITMSRSACEFVTPLTFESLTGHEVATELFPKAFTATKHIDWADWADLIIVAPASANTIGKLANGIYDNLLTTIISAATCPVIIAPAMNSNMWANSFVQENLKKLAKHKYLIVPPEHGDLACGWIGEGRLAQNEHIIQYIFKALNEPILKDVNVLISAGPTIEDIDPVRFISNRSSGKMGYAIAYAAWSLGANVTLISGPSTEKKPFEITTSNVRSAADMAELVQKSFKSCDLFISTAAVADFTPTEIANNKIKKNNKESLSLSLVKTIDILKSLKKTKSQRVIGFAVETQNELEHAYLKLNSKNLDAIVLNNPKIEGAGFDHDTNIATLIFNDGREIQLEKQSKLSMAFAILKSL